MGKQTVCVDFNGVLDTYAGWVEGGTGTEYPPRDGAKQFLEQLHHKYKVIIHTAIDVQHVLVWLFDNGMGGLVDEVTNTKPPAIAYIDDRAICFKGDYEDTLKQLEQFQPWWRK